MVQDTPEDGTSGMEGHIEEGTTKKLWRGMQPASLCLGAATQLLALPRSTLLPPHHIRTPCLGRQIALGPRPCEKHFCDDGELCIRAQMKTQDNVLVELPK